MKTAKKLVIFFVLPIVLLVSSAAIYLYIKRSGPYYLPDITLESFDGTPFALKSLRGKPSLVVFWASTCSTCISELPKLIKLYNDYSPKDLEIVGIVIYYNDPNQAYSMMQKKHIPYRILLDRNKKATYAFGGVQYTPTTFLVSPSGRIVYRETGKTDFGKLREVLQKILKGS
jgi:thiol-disulfide isomerase/thioredoxin